MCKEQKQKKLPVHKSDHDSDSDCDSSVDLYSVTVPCTSTDAMYVQLQVEGIHLNMELDTGASVSVIGGQQYKELLPHVPLRKTQLRLQMCRRRRRP